MYLRDTNQTNQSLNLLLGRFLLRYTDRFLSRWTVYTIDLLLVLATYLAAQFIAFNFLPGAIPWHTLPAKVGIIVLVYGLAFLHAQSYVGVVRQSGSKDLSITASAAINRYMQ